MNHTLEEKNSEMIKEATTKNNKDADVDVFVAKHISDSKKMIVEVDGDVEKYIDANIVKYAFEPKNVIVEVPSEETNNLNIMHNCFLLRRLLRLHPHEQLMVYVDEKGVGSYPPSIEEVVHIADNSIDGNDELYVADISVVQVNSEKQITTQRKWIPLQELHDVVSHKIDFDANVDTRTKDDSNNSKFKETAKEDNLDQVLHQVAREAGISSKSM
ncbi:hypothetical protein K7X08_011341 [Anisodus acutangulus]|uniref:Uncharacterized protein n=1 Tax=Anisodus acutangulus TaxID=402998 RepID=A0A9Q1M0E1_9SOLA|nr:hypothetical protein K7X08_011341 [Anisodus acutangulus]